MHYVSHNIFSVLLYNRWVGVQIYNVTTSGSLAIQFYMFSLTIFRLQCSWAYYFFLLFLSLTYYGGFAQPFLVSSPSWHHTVLQGRGVCAHTELSRQVAVQAASSAWRRQAGRLAGRGRLVGLVPPHGLRHLGRVSPGGETQMRETRRIWYLIQHTYSVKIGFEATESDYISKDNHCSRW